MKIEKNRLQKSLTLLAITTFLLLLSTFSFAHPGPTDDRGCHEDSRGGHCHV